jgi:CRP-like cAMP-binding protein
MTEARSDAALAKFPLLKGMTSAEKEELLSLMERHRYSPGDLILAEGASTQAIWVVLSGECRASKATVDGAEKVLTTIEPGGVFGEMSFFQPAPHSATVKALSAVEVACLPREKYDLLLRVGSLAAYKMVYNTMGVLVERLRRMDEWVAGRLEKSNGSPEHHEEWLDFHTKLYTGWQF